jgi:antitoxin FitA
MAQLVVRNLADSVKAKLKERAQAGGRSLVMEVRAILAAAVGDAVTGPQPEVGLATRMQEIFAGAGLTEEEFRTMQSGIAGFRANGKFTPADFDDDR